ncbi:hypothetical protein [Bacillus atrophaeus]|uniref:hypothetical protein n=1 Tax=Bacillus atrophaeus TaxID=1452 RepID=UPI002E1AD168|nr:hypothetical protein [Bacillus atrophaeus]
MAPIGRGVRKVNESIMQDGRTLIITEQNDAQLDWDRIPDGTLKIDPETGQLFIKIKGEGSWIPAGLTYDGNLTIAKDARVVYEVFKIVRANNGDGTFTYSNEAGEHRTKPLTKDGKQVFELEKGSYIVKRNKIEAYINDTLHRSATSGGLTEVDETRIALTDNVANDTKVTFKYFLKFNIGNPYPRFFINPEEPETADYGDFWLDINEGMSILKWWDGTEWKALSSEEMGDILGGSVIYKGFNVVPGSGRSVSVDHDPDGLGVLFIEGVRFREPNNINNIAVSDNTSGSTRQDTLYAKIAGNKLTYHVRAGSTSAPAGTAKIAQIDVPNGATSISASNITLERKALTIKFISDEIHSSTNKAVANTLMRRDSGGRVKAAAPQEDDDVVRKAENDLKVAKAGDTMTGKLLIEGFGVHPRMVPVTGGTSGASYPLGITTFKNGTLSGYPTSNGMIVNYKPSDALLTQWLYAGGFGGEMRSWFRHWNSSSGWTDFKEVRDLGETADTAYRGDRGKVSYDHSQVRDDNPHQTKHDQLLERGEVNVASTDTSKNKHVSNAQAKKWEDHVDAAHPHTEHPQAPANTRIFVQSSKPTSGMSAGDIWIDTSVSYGTK